MSEYQPSFASVNEENMYRVMQTRKTVDWVFQYPLNGGRSVPGGQVIDFAILSPLRYALYLGHGEGGYWHGGANEMSDKIKQSQAERAGFMVVLFTNADTATYEAAYASYMREVGL